MAAPITDAYRLRMRREALGILQPVTEKRCVHCWETKPRAEFPASTQVSDGVSSWCRSCHREATRRWKAKRKAEAGNPRRRNAAFEAWLDGSDDAP